MGLKDSAKAAAKDIESNGQEAAAKATEATLKLKPKGKVQQA